MAEVDLNPFATQEIPQESTVEKDANPKVESAKEAFELANSDEGFCRCIWWVGDEEAGIFLDGEISDEVLDRYEEVRGFLEDPEVREFLDIALADFPQPDMESLRTAVKDLNKKNEYGKAAITPDFITQIHPVTSLYQEFYKKMILKNPEHIVGMVEDELRNLYYTMDADFDDFFDLLRQNPQLVISSYRWERMNSHDIIPEDEIGTSKELDKDKLVKLWDVAESLPNAYRGNKGKLSYRTPEVPRALDCLYAYAMGTRDMERFLRIITKGYEDDGREDAYFDRNGYIGADWGTTETMPKTGIKIHVPVNLLASDFPNMLRDIAQTTQQYDTHGMKTQRYDTEGVFVNNTKGITVYPNIGHEGDAEDPLSNIENALNLAKALDERLRKYAKPKPTPYPTDLPVGESNMVTIRFCRFVTEDTSELVIDGDPWKDDREKSFGDNLPTTMVLDQMVTVANNIGLELNPRNYPVRQYEVAGAKSLEGLLGVLQGRFGSVSQGVRHQDKSYTGEQLVRMIEGYMKNEHGPEYITSTLGLRQKVLELSSK